MDLKFDGEMWMRIPRPFKTNLVGGFNPIEKYDRQNGFIFPKVRGENSKNDKKCLKPKSLVACGRKPSKSGEVEASESSLFAPWNLFAVRPISTAAS